MESTPALNQCERPKKLKSLGDQLGGQLRPILGAVSGEHLGGQMEPVEVECHITKISAEDFASFRAEALRDFCIKTGLRGQKLIIVFGKQAPHQTVFGS